MLIGLGDNSGLFSTLVAQATTVPPPAGSPAANALVGSTTPNPLPGSEPAPTRLPLLAVAHESQTPVSAAIPAVSTYPLGLTGTQWLLIAGAVTILIYFLVSHKGGKG